MAEFEGSLADYKFEQAIVFGSKFQFGSTR